MGPFHMETKDFPSPHIFSDLNGDIPSVYILEYPSFQMKPIALSSSLLSRQGILLSLHEVIFSHTSGFKIPIFVQIVALSASSQVLGEMPGSWKRGCSTPECWHCVGHTIPVSALSHRIQHKGSAPNA